MAYHGHRVILYDNDLKSLNSAYTKLEEDKKYLHEQGLLFHKNFVVRSKLFIYSSVHTFTDQCTFSKYVYKITLLLTYTFKYDRCSGITMH